jgi:hypothetical protein
MDDDFTALGDTFIQLVGSNEKPKEPTVAEWIDEEYRRRKYGPPVYELDVYRYHRDAAYRHDVEMERRYRDGYRSPMRPKEIAIYGTVPSPDNGDAWPISQFDRLTLPGSVSDAEADEVAQKIAALVERRTQEAVAATMQRVQPAKPVKTVRVPEPETEPGTHRRKVRVDK